MVAQRSSLSRPLLLVAIFLLTIGVLPAVTRGAPAAAAITTEPAPAAAGRLLFIENAGQWPDAARFQVWGGGQTLWLAEDALWITATGRGEASPEDLAADQTPGLEELFGLQQESHGMPRPYSPAVNIRLSFPGANPYPTLEPLDRLDTHVSYFLGSDPEQWRADVPVWGGVRYRDLYPGVDLVVGARADPAPLAPALDGGRPQGSPLPWRLEARDGADLSAVRLRVEGADAVAVEGEALRLSTALGDIAVPLLTLDRANVERPDVERLNVQAFDVTAPFTITPANSQSAVQNPQSRDLLYGTFLGGKYHDYGLALAVDPAGSAYVTGYTGSASFPVTPGAIDTNNNHDAFMAKLDPGGSGLVYATFLGGNGWDVGKAITVDVAGSTYMAGFTFSRDFPVTPGAFDMSFNGYLEDAFVVKLNPAGSTLHYSTFLGGSGDDGATGIAVDVTGSAYTTGYTESADFPVTPRRMLSIQASTAVMVATAMRSWSSWTLSVVGWPTRLSSVAALAVGTVAPVSR